MGLVKREMEKYEAQEPGNEWILEAFGFGPEMEGTEEWREAKKAFRQHVRELRRQENNEYDEWLFDALMANAGHKRACNVAMEELDTLLSLIITDSLPHEQQVTLLKMAVTHSITLMESCFQEMLTSALFTPASVMYKRNAFENLSGLKNNLKRPLSDILTQKPMHFLDDVLKAYLSGLSLTSYKDVTNHFKAVTGVKQVNAFPPHQKPMEDAVHLRNDMVHRNGAGMDGKNHEVDVKMLQEHIATVRSFIRAVSKFLDENIDYEKQDKKQK